MVRRRPHFHRCHALHQPLAPVGLLRCVTTINLGHSLEFNKIRELIAAGEKASTGIPAKHFTQRVREQQQHQGQLRQGSQGQLSWSWGMSPADMLRLTLPLLLSVPAAGLVSLPSSSRGLVSHRSSPLYLSTSAAAKTTKFDRSSFGGGGISLPPAETGWPRRAQRLQRGSKSIKHPLSSGWGVGVVCGAGGDSNGGDDESSGRRNDDSERGNNDGANSAPKDEGSLMAEKQGANSTGDGDDSLQTSAFSFSTLEDELQARAAQKAATTQRDGARSGGGTTADEGEDAWLPRFFPPPLPGQDDEEGDAIQPLMELPLDGILLQLFPALLIGVLGLFLTVAIQVEAGRFDGMVGEDGGAVVVTDLRDTRTQEQP